MEENVKEQCRQKILKAARKLIAEKGAANTTLRNIATEAGVSNGALYYYFHSKDLILYEIMDEDTSAAAELAKRVNEKNFTQEELETVALKVLTQRITDSQENRLFYYLAHEAMLGNKELREKFQEKYESWFNSVDEIVAGLLDVQKSPKTRAIANIILAAIDGLCLQRQIGLNHSLESEWEIYKKLILLGRAKELLARD